MQAFLHRPLADPPPHDVVGIFPNRALVREDLLIAAADRPPVADARRRSSSTVVGRPGQPGWCRWPPRRSGAD